MAPQRTAKIQGITDCWSSDHAFNCQQLWNL